MTNNPNKILKKFNLNSDDNNMSFNAVGKINVTKKEIIFEKFIYNNQIVNAADTKTVKDLIDTYVLNEGALGFLDFLKLKNLQTSLLKI